MSRTTPHRVSRVAITGAALLMLAACNGTAEDETPIDAAGDEGTAETTEATEAVQTDIVSMIDNEFEPAANEVAAGSTVTWVHDGEEQHNVIFDDGTESELLDSGQTYERTFDEAGDYPYVCTLHAGMEGTVTVTE